MRGTIRLGKGAAREGGARAELFAELFDLDRGARAIASRCAPDVAIVGAPFDDAVSHRPGARFGPRAIDCDLLLWEGGEWRDERDKGQRGNRACNIQ